MNNIVKQVCLLYEQELYTDVIRLSELSISICEQKQDVVMQFSKFQLYVYYADSLFNLHQYVAAEHAYSLALQFRKHIIKSKNALKLQEGEKNIISDIDIKYKVHLCCLKLKQHREAIEILQSISARSRTPKINMALGNLYRDAGMERPATSCYKEVLRECPLALDAAENLLKLGVQGIEVNSMMLGATVELGWTSTWLRGLAEMYSREHNSAIATFKTLDTPGLLKNNCTLLINMAQCHNFLCDDKKAIALLQRVLCINPHFTIGRDLLSSLLGNSSTKDDHKALERLVPEYDMSLWACEHWVAMGYLMYVNDKYDKAAYFGQQACQMNRRNIEALLLKALTFMQISKYQEASYHFREALQLCPYRFEANYGLVHSYVAMNRLREAITVANNACKQMNHVAPALTLYGSVLLKDPINSARARSILERAIATDPSYAQAATLLAKQLEQEQAYDEAIAVLKRHLEVNPASKVHQMIGDCFVRLQKDDEAFVHYSTALRMDPQNQRALEGMNNLGRSPTSNKLDSSYYMPVGEEGSSYTTPAPVGSDHEADQDSDTDQWPNNNRDLMSFE